MQREHGSAVDRRWRAQQIRVWLICASGSLETSLYDDVMSSAADSAVLTVVELLLYPNGQTGRALKARCRI